MARPLAALLLLLCCRPAHANPETTVDLPNGATMTMVWVAPGTFTMGSPETEEGRDPGEGPQHEVSLSAGFYLGKYEVTREQWEKAMGTTPWAGYDYVLSDPACPAVYVSWSDVQALVHRLNQAAGDSLYRLPTEAEWEYACRAGTRTKWPFGDDETQLGEYAWYRPNAWEVGEGYAHPVGTKQPNPWGICDMHGNVWEWCQDWFGEYADSPQTDPVGPASGSARVMRGGNLHNYARFTRSAMRGSGPPDLGSYNLGARLVRLAPAGHTPASILLDSWGDVKAASAGRSH